MREKETVRPLVKMGWRRDHRPAETLVLRSVRHWLTARATDTALWAAPWLSPRALDGLGAALGRWGALTPGISGIVAENLRAAGVYDAAVHRLHFAQLGAHFAGALHALAAPASSGTMPASSGAGTSALAALAEERVALDDSVGRLVRALTAGRGAILVGPHTCNYLLNLTRLNAVVPLTVYLRYSRDERRRAAKQRWYAASGVGWISEPADAGGALGRLGRMAAALAEGRVLFITPDLPQKQGAGVPVQFLEREIYLPAGAGLLAERSGAPLFMLTARADAILAPSGVREPREDRRAPVPWCAPAGLRQRLIVSGPYAPQIPAETARRAAAGRRGALQARLQWFADLFACFLRQQAPLWYLWGDKRWTRVFRGDPRYVQPARLPRQRASQPDHAGVPNRAGAG